MNKNLFIGLLTCMGLLPVQAQTFSISEFSIPAGGTADVDICLDCKADTWGAFQFDLVLPTGITVFEDKYGMYFTYTNRLTYIQGRVTQYFNVNGSLQNDGTYRIIIDNSNAQTITGTTGPLLSVRLQANDNLDTDWQTIGIKNITCTGPTGEGTVYPADIAAAGRGMVRVDAVVGSTGWATFSWPRSCDFTGLDVEAYIGTILGDGYLHLEQVYNVRQNTGILLHGTPGTYHPSVGADLGHDYDNTEANILQSTAMGAVTTQDAYAYVLANHDDALGFYPAQEGLRIPQYRAYLQMSADAGAPAYVWIDGVQTSISEVAVPQTESDVWYRMDGTRVKNPTRPGIYVKQGKKVKL